MQIGHSCGCHQLPERSFFFKGYQFPICARCTGMFAGELLTYILFAFKVLISPLAAVILLGTMGFDWFIQFTGVLPSTNPRRFITGIAGGIGFSSLFLRLVKEIIRLFRN